MIERENGSVERECSMSGRSNDAQQNAAVARRTRATASCHAFEIS